MNYHIFKQAQAKYLMHFVKVLNLLAWIHFKAQEVIDLRHLGLETHQLRSPKAPEVEKLLSNPL